MTVLILTANGAGGEGNVPIQMGSRLELFVDDLLIERMSGVRLRLHPPRMAEKVMTFDQPWEGTTSAYVTVFQDGDLYKMYYRGSGGATGPLQQAINVTPAEVTVIIGIDEAPGNPDPFNQVSSAAPRDLVNIVVSVPFEQSR